MFQVFEGENQIAEENHFVGEFTLPIPRAKAGELELEVEFSVDFEGRLRVSAVENTSGNKLTFDVQVRMQDSGTGTYGRGYQSERFDALKGGGGAREVSKYLIISGGT
jgi:molecular chaperone DnaK (HSP70)